MCYAFLANRLVLPPISTATRLTCLSTASWNWNGSAPSGEVAEKKDEGEVAIQSKRGNTIKKAAQPNDPAIHLARPGNDVVKNQSELDVEEKKADGGEEDNKEEEEDKEEAVNGEAESAQTGEKRKAEDEAEGDGESAKKPKARGRPKGSSNTPKKAEGKAPAKKKAKSAPKEKPAAGDGEKAAAPRGRPKKEGGATKPPKEKKAPKADKPKAPATGIGKRTRSGGK